jgi:5-methyltetrahydrofolate--homocysteine methyltransferase
MSQETLESELMNPFVELKLRRSIMGKTLETISNGVIQGDHNLVREQVRGALEKESAPETVLKQALIPAMSEVGRLFEDGAYFVPEMLVAA